MRLLLVRHGDPDYIHDSLTADGQREAELLSVRFAGEHVDECFVSPMGRAKATAAPSLEKLGQRARECDWLQEFSIPVARPDTDGLSPVPWDWLPQDWLQDPRFLDREHWAENPVFSAVGLGESYQEVVTAFDSLLAEHGYVRDGLLYRAERPNSKTLAFFCHFGVSCLLLSHLMNVSPMVLWQGLVMAPSSVTTVYTEERRPGHAVFRTACIGDTSHLYVEKVPPSFAARFCEVYGNGDRID